MLFCRPCFPVTADDVTYDGACQCQGGETCCGTTVLPNSQMPKLKLTYFDMPGRAGKIRLALHLAQIPFEDQRVGLLKVLGIVFLHLEYCRSRKATGLNLNRLYQ